MKFYDSHTHLNAEPLLQEWESYLQRFIDAGGVGIVNSGASEEYNIQAIEISKQSSDKNIVVKATLGWHPMECFEGDITLATIAPKMQWIRDRYLANKECVVGVGETGIDVHYPRGLETLDIQRQLFIEHCKLAREFNLPLVIHSRDDFETTFEIIKNYTDLTIYFHCRGYGTEQINRLQVEGSRLGWKLFFGFCGNVTYKNAQVSRDSLAMIARDQILLETDAPYLVPQIVRGETNHPANVKYIYQYVAEYLKMDIEELALQVEKNFKAVYGL